MADLSDGSMADPDYVIVGSGINALVAAALLTGAGRRVLLLERNKQLGGCLRSDQLIAPGFLHDVMATTCVLFVTSPAYAELGAALAKHGLEFCNGDEPTGVLLPDGRHAVLSRDRARNMALLDALAPGDGRRYGSEMTALGSYAPLLFSLLGGRLWSAGTAWLMLREAWRRGPRGLASFIGEFLAPARASLEAGYRSDVSRALFAPWVLHCGLGPESALSGEMAKVVPFALEAAGAPIVKGGARNLVAAFEGLIRAQAGEIETEADVVRVKLDGSGAAMGVILADGAVRSAKKGVICSVSPGALYGKLLAGSRASAACAAQVEGYRYGKGNLQVHYALRSPPKWRAGDLGRVALLHLTPGLDGVSRAVNEAERGLLPAEPTICVGQPTALDLSRAPAGQAVLWLQLPECPRVIKGDALGEIAVGSSGQWTEEIRERFANRIEAILASHIDGFSDLVIGRRVLSPTDLEAMNVNLVGGDPYGGSCSLDQFLLWRPFKTTVNHRTAVPNLFHIGAATHPGPGLAGGSGYLAAKALL